MDQDEKTTEPETTTGASSPDDVVAHLANLQFNDIGDDVADEDAPIDLTAETVSDDLPEAGDALLSRDQFFSVFKTAFDMPGLFAPVFKPLGIGADEQDRARAASDATYGLLEIYYPAALIPQSQVVAHLLVAGPFFISKAMIVRECLRAARQPPTPPPGARSAPANKAHSDLIIGGQDDDDGGQVIGFPPAEAAQ